MGKVKLLLDVIGDLRSLADSLQAVADAVADNGAAEAELTTTKEPEKAGKAGKGAAKKDTVIRACRQNEPLSDDGYCGQGHTGYHDRGREQGPFYSVYDGGQGDFRP